MLAEHLSRRRLVILLCIGLLVVPVLLAHGGARLSVPRSVARGATVTVHASDLRLGRYSLSIASGHVLAGDEACLMTIASLPHEASSFSLSGRIPARLSCLRGTRPAGSRPVTPGTYELIVSVRSSAGVVSERYSDLGRTVTIS